MDEILAKYSKTTIAFVAIGLGILFIVLMDPPKGKCDAQKDYFKEQQIGGLYLDPELKIKNSKNNIAPFDRQIDFCKQTNRPGGCYEYFSKVRDLLRDIDTVSEECLPTVTKMKSVKTALDKSLKLMTEIAWGDGPRGFSASYSWLDNSDMALFCQLRKTYKQSYSSRWSKVTHKILSELPGAQALGSEADYWKKAWKKSLLAINCDAYY